MKSHLLHRTSALVLVAALATPAWSAGLLDSVKDQAGQYLGGGSNAAASSPSSSGGALAGLGGLGLPAIGSGTSSNVAGVLEYCVKNNYLNPASAQGVKDKLLGKIGLGGGQAQQDSGYQQGLGGVLKGSDGSSFSLDRVKGNLKEKACDYVLDNAKSFIWPAPRIVSATTVCRRKRMGRSGVAREVRGVPEVRPAFQAR
ncbi:MAG: hypothetical protein GAK30_01784 [Paracidovorax wautersii]|uniref:DUF2501 domain-containing protein n=1 Tax=Paracidovorax wautersii TaxID=1177982 RepID=A0A7V8JQP9_9BURK|nr:MAG: hypothetical protein GAK30_01784 [Paracidovorax wautersii]